MTTPKTTFAGLALIAALCAVGMLGLTAPAWAGFDEAVAAYKRGDYATALREYRTLAKQGNAGAQYNIGVMYYNGQGVPQDYAKAVKWYRKATEQGNAGAQYNLGIMYYFGLGVPQDDAKALQWYRKAAEQGHAKTQFILGFVYSNGQGVSQDYVQAHMWYNLAASKSSPGEDLDRAVKNRDIVAKKMTPAQIGEAQKLAREWRQK